MGMGLAKSVSASNCFSKSTIYDVRIPIGISIKRLNGKIH